MVPQARCKLPIKQQAISSIRSVQPIMPTRHHQWLSWRISAGRRRSRWTRITLRVPTSKKLRQVRWALSALRQQTICRPWMQVSALVFNRTRALTQCESCSRKIGKIQVGRQVRARTRIKSRCGCLLSRPCRRPLHPSNQAQWAENRTWYRCSSRLLWPQLERTHALPCNPCS